jgi:predicted GH43/DUF377 family glycosyl hydrolase
VDQAADRMHVYYGAADTTVALATASFSDVLAYVNACPPGDHRRVSDLLD